MHIRGETGVRVQTFVISIVVCTVVGFVLGWFAGTF